MLDVFFGLNALVSFYFWWLLYALVAFAVRRAVHCLGSDRVAEAFVCVSSSHAIPRMGEIVCCGEDVCLW